ncbi:HAD family hydrolase [Kribbella sp. NBC_00889]|uniref:HAD family hydrolase n=1 Tax=Kribbella sp. NBC_00889 TaxID=2975974 RepID=UPI003863F83B|nr:HAD-IA family hydrolase [Kribbella sp. NBC_00889]
MNRLAAVVFDVDGTLVDSERDGHRVAFNAAFEEAGLPDHWDIATYGRLLRITGGARRLAVWFEQTGRSSEDARRLAERLHARKTAIMRDLIEDGKVQARPGVHRLLDELEAGGVPVHVATTGTRAWVEPLLDRAFGPRFQIVVTGTEVPDLKPSPAAYNEVLRLAGCPVDRTVAVEDSQNGVRAAVAAGLRVVAAHNEYTRDDDLSGADLVADGFEDPDLVAWFRQ